MLITYDEEKDAVLFEAFTLEEVALDDLRGDRDLIDRLNFHAGE